MDKKTDTITVTLVCEDRGGRHAFGALEHDLTVLKTEFEDAQGLTHLTVRGARCNVGAYIREWFKSAVEDCDIEAFCRECSPTPFCGRFRE